MKLDRPALLYDGDCRFCRFTARAVEVLDRRRRFGYLPFADELALELLAPVPPSERQHSIHLVFPNGDIASAGDALAELSRVLPDRRGPRSPARARRLPLGLRPRR